MKGKTIKSLLISATMTAAILTGCGSKDTESEITTEVETATIGETTTESEITTTEQETSTIEEETTTETETFSYTVSELDKTMCVIASGQALDIPSENGNVISTIDQNDTIKVTGKVNETDWYQVEIDNQTFYISSSLLSEIEVKTETKETTTNKETTTKQETTTNTTNETPQIQPATDNTPASTPSSSDTTTSSSSTLAPGESRVERDGSITTNVDNAWWMQ